MHVSKRWIYRILAASAAIFLALYFLVRPMAMQTLEPMLASAAAERVRGTVSWRAVDLDPAFDLKFEDIELKDAQGMRVFFAPGLSVRWTIAGALSAYFHDSGVAAMVQTVRVETPDITLRKEADGSWNVQKLIVSESEGPSEFRGRVLLQNGKVAVYLPGGEMYAAENVGGQVSWGTGGVIEAVLDAHTFGTDVSGKLVYTDENRYYGKLETKDLPLKELSPLLALLPDSAEPAEISEGTGKITKAEVDCKDGKLKYLAEGIVSDATLSVKGYTFKNTSAHFALSEEKLSVSDMKLRAEGADVSADIGGNLDISFGEPFTFDAALAVGEGRLTVSGSYETKTGECYAMYDLANVDLSILKGFANVGGVVSGKGSLSGAYNDGGFSLHRTEGDFYGKRLSYDTYGAQTVAAHATILGDASVIAFDGEGISVEGLYLDTACGEISGADKTWRIPYIIASMGDGAMAARGTVTDGVFDLRAEAAGVELGNFALLAGYDIGGTASAEGCISGTADAFSYRADFRLTDGHFEAAPIGRADGSIHGDTDMLYIDNATVTLSEGTHHISGSVGLTGEKTLSLTEETKHARIENILKLVGLDVPVTGWFDNKVTIGGTMDNPDVSGNILATEGSIAGELYQSVYVDYAFQDGKFTIPNGFGYMYGGTAQAVGSYENGKLDFTLALVDVDLDRVLPSTPVEGYATFRGHLTGTTDSPEFNGNVESREILIDGKGLGRVSAQVMYKDGIFRITDGYFQHRAGEFKWNGLVNAETGALDGRLIFQKWRIADALDLFGLPVKNVAGTMDGSMRLRGTFDNPNLSLTMRTADAKLGHLSMGEGKLDMSYANHILSIREMNLPIGEGLVMGKGTLSKDGALDMKLDTKNLDVSFVSEILDKDNLTFGGMMTADLTLKGDVKDPEAQLTLDVTNPVYNEIPFNELSFKGHMHAGVLTISDAFMTKNVYKGTLSGTMPVAAILGEDDGRQIPFDFTINLDNADLNALALFVKPVKEAKGPIDGKLHVTGEWNDPEITGHISVENGEMTVETFAEPITPMKGTMTFSGKEATLSAEAKIRDNVATAEGRVSWDKMKFTGYEGTAHADADTIRSDYYNGALHADITVSEEHGLPKVAGQVSVENATIHVPLSYEEGGDSYDMLMDVAVSVGDRVRLYHSLLFDMYVRGNVHAMGLVSKPIMSGKVDVDRGVVKYLTNNFTIKQGSAVFGTVPDSFMPTLNLRGETKVGQYKVNMELTGPVGQFRFRLRSEPALNDSQIVKLLTFHQDVSGSGNSNGNTDETGALFNAGLQMVFNGTVQNFLQNSFGLDLFSVTTSNDTYFDSKSGSGQDEYYHIKIGKYLFDNFMLTATMGVNNDQKSYGFRYDLRSRWGITAWYNTETKEYIGAEYQFKF